MLFIVLNCWNISSCYIRAICKTFSKLSYRWSRRECHHFQFLMIRSFPKFISANHRLFWCRNSNFWDMTGSSPFLQCPASKTPLRSCSEVSKLVSAFCFLLDAFTIVCVHFSLHGMVRPTACLYDISIT